MDVLKQNLGVDAELIKGSGGIFTIAVNGVVVSAKQNGNFPSEEEMLQKVSQALQN